MFHKNKTLALKTESLSWIFLHASLPPVAPISDTVKTCVYLAPIIIQILHLPFCWQHTTIMLKTLLHLIILWRMFKENKLLMHLLNVQPFS